MHTFPVQVTRYYHNLHGHIEYLQYMCHVSMHITMHSDKAIDLHIVQDIMHVKYSIPPSDDKVNLRKRYSQVLTRYTFP